MSREPKLTSIYTGRHLEAQIMKSLLESFGIPAMLRYESAGLVVGITVDGLGQTSVLVPQDLAEDAREILETQDFEETES